MACCFLEDLIHLSLDAVAEKYSQNRVEDNGSTRHGGQDFILCCRIKNAPV